MNANSAILLMVRSWWHSMPSTKFSHIPNPCFCVVFSIVQEMTCTGTLNQFEKKEFLSGFTVSVSLPCVNYKSSAQQAICRLDWAIDQPPETCVCHGNTSAHHNQLLLQSQLAIDLVLPITTGLHHRSVLTISQWPFFGALFGCIHLANYDRARGSVVDTMWALCFCDCGNQAHR